MFEVFSKEKKKPVFEIENFPKNPSGFHANSRHIAKFGCKANVKPIPEETLTPAFGFMLFQKLTRLLGSKSALLRKKALQELCNLYQHDPMKIVDSVRSNVIDGLLRLVCEDPDETIRKYSSQALELLSRNKYGRDQLIKGENNIERINKSCTDDSPDVCVNSLTCLKNVGREMLGQVVLCRQCIPLLINILEKNSWAKVKTASSKAICASLQAEQSYPICIENNLVGIFAMLLGDQLELKKDNDDDRDVLLGSISYCLALLCFQEEGVAEGVKHKVITPLVMLMNETKNASTRESISAALMYLTLAKPGKKQFIHLDNSVSKSVELVLDRNELMVTRINSLKIMCNVVDNPLGRKKLDGNVEDLIALRDEKDPDFLKSLEIAISKIVNIVQV